MKGRKDVRHKSIQAKRNPIRNMFVGAWKKHVPPCGFLIVKAEWRLVLLMAWLMWRETNVQSPDVCVQLVLNHENVYNQRAGKDVRNFRNLWILEKLLYRGRFQAYIFGKLWCHNVFGSCRHWNIMRVLRCICMHGMRRKFVDNFVVAFLFATIYSHIYFYIFGHIYICMRAGRRPSV